MNRFPRIATPVDTANFATQKNRVGPDDEDEEDDAPENIAGPDDDGDDDGKGGD